MLNAKHNIFLSYSYHTYSINNNEYCWWRADLFDTWTDKNAIMWNMIDSVNEWNSGLINFSNVIAIFHNHSDNNENYSYFEIYKYNQNFQTEDNYINQGSKVWFWSINIKHI